MVRVGLETRVSRKNWGDNVSFILDEMIQKEADGVDFVPFCKYLLDGNYDKCQVIESYTKEQWINGSRCCPKTPRLYWKMVGGTKRYIVRENKSEDNLFTRLPNPDGTVDLFMNKKMFDKAVEPFCKKMEDK